MEVVGINKVPSKQIIIFLVVKKVNRKIYTYVIKVTNLFDRCYRLIYLHERKKKQKTTKHSLFRSFQAGK